MAEVTKGRKSRKAAAETAAYVSAEFNHQHMAQHHSTAHPSGAHEASAAYLDALTGAAPGNVGKSGTATVEDNHGAVIGSGTDPRASATPPDPGSPAVGNPYGPRDFASLRLSEPLTAGQSGSAASGDHNLGAGRNPGLAVGIPGRNIDQGRVNPSPWQSLATAQQDRADADIIYTPGRVNVQHLDLSTPANAPSFRDPVSGNPNVRQRDHISRDSATPANPLSAVLGQAASSSRPPMSAKSHTPYEMMREFVHESLNRRG